MAWQELYTRKRRSAADAAALVRDGDTIIVPTGVGEPPALLTALSDQRHRLQGVTVSQILAMRKYAYLDPATVQHVRHVAFFYGGATRAGGQAGWIDFTPNYFSEIPQLIDRGQIASDVVFSMASSLGADYTMAAVRRARAVVLEVNPNVPFANGRCHVHISQVAALVESSEPVLEVGLPRIGAVQEAIGKFVAEFIEDGSTLQIGLGRVTNEALKFLADRKDLGIHSDVITDAIIPLLEKGILNGRRKTQQPRKIVTSFAIGSQRLYALIDRNPLFSFQPIEQVCDPTVIAAQHKMVSVTQAFALDLTGQVCADQLGGELYGGIAAQGEFLQGASRSVGGKAIICLASTETDSTGALRSRVRAVLEPGEAATIARSDVHYVITEYGIAYLFGKSIRERAIALIQIAHPQFRPTLLDEARRRGYVPPEQTMQNLRAYPVEEEKTVKLKDTRQVLLRPAAAHDADGIRDLFHDLPERDVYTRFFRRVKGMSDKDVQRLCNLNFENEVAFVAVAGPREAEDIVAQACYFIDPSTNLAETAFMVHPDWQGTGLGSALQQRMAEHAAGRGVRGFVAEIMASNDGMIQLARSGLVLAGGPAKVSVENSGSTVRITTLF